MHDEALVVVAQERVVDLLGEVVAAELTAFFVIAVIARNLRHVNAVLKLGELDGRLDKTREIRHRVARETDHRDRVHAEHVVDIRVCDREERSDTELRVERTKAVHPVRDVLALLILARVRLVLVAVDAIVAVEVNIHFDDALHLRRGFRHRALRTKDRQVLRLRLREAADGRRRHHEGHVADDDRPVGERLEGRALAERLENLALHLIAVIKFF